MLKHISENAKPVQISPYIWPPTALELEKISNLSFEGGGPAGLLYAGILERLEKHQLRAGIKRTIGTSAGSIVAAIVALGGDAATLKYILESTDLETLLDDECALKSLYDVYQHYGLNDGDEIEQSLMQIFASMGYDPSITLAQLEAQRQHEIATTGHSNLCELYIMMCDLNRKPSRHVAHANDPFYKDVPIAKLVRASCSIPAMFEPVYIHDHMHVDGGIVENNPARYFDKAKFLDMPAAQAFDPETYIYNPHTLAFRLFNPEDLEAYLNPNKYLNLPKVTSFKTFFQRLLHASVEGQEKDFEKDAFRTVFGNRAGITGTDFSISNEQKELLVNNGRWAFDLFVLENQKRELNKSIPANVRDYVVAFLKRSQSPLPEFNFRSLTPQSLALNEGIQCAFKSTPQTTLTRSSNVSSSSLNGWKTTSDKQPRSNRRKGYTLIIGLVAVVTLPFLAIEFSMAALGAMILGLASIVTLAIAALQLTSILRQRLQRKSQPIQETAKSLQSAADDPLLHSPWTAPYLMKAHTPTNGELYTPDSLNTPEVHSSFRIA